MDENQWIGWCDMLREGKARLGMLFPITTTLSLLVFGWFWFLQLIRWVNDDPDQQQVRLLWVGLWCGGVGFLITAIVSLLQVGRQFFN